jgi:GPH family glycoside/pentoside/hexuronide:cation symporter
MFNAPFSGERPAELLLYFAATWLLWETASTMLGTAYLGLLPEMFRSFAERSDVAVRMNAVQVVGLLLGLALPPLLAARLGWGAVGAGLALLCVALVYGNLRPLFERPQASAAPLMPLLALLRLTFTNRSFLTVVAAQTMRFLATGILASGMGFYVKYSLGEPGGAVTSLLLAIAFVTAGLCLWPWHRFVAQPYGARTTLLAAFAVSGLAVVPLLWVGSVAGAVLTTVLFGAGLSGMILMGDVIMADVIDEAELRSGQRQEGAYYGLSGLIITLSGGVTAALFGWVSHRYGYDPSLAAQPETVAQGFRLFMSVPPLVSAALAFVLLWFYPLRGERLRAMRRELAARRAASERSS